MRFEDAEKQVRSSFGVLIEDTQHLIVRYENESGPEPKDDTPLWIRFAVFTGQSRRVEMSGNGGTNRHFGVLSASVLAAVNTGTKAAVGLAGLIVSTFQSKIISGIHYGDAEPIKLGAVGKWYQINVTCPYHVDQVGE